jgi:hypothetical protein
MDFPPQSPSKAYWFSVTWSPSILDRKKNKLYTFAKTSATFLFRATTRHPLVCLSIRCTNNGRSVLSYCRAGRSCEIEFLLPNCQQSKLIRTKITLDDYASGLIQHKEMLVLINNPRSNFSRYWIGNSLFFRTTLWSLRFILEIQTQ